MFFLLSWEIGFEGSKLVFSIGKGNGEIKYMEIKFCLLSLIFDKNAYPYWI